MVLSLDFQRIGNEEFETAAIFCTAFAEYVLETLEMNTEAKQLLDRESLRGLQEASGDGAAFSLRKLFSILSSICKTAQKPVVLIIDEVDSATNNQVFLDFLAQLRSYYLNRTSKNTPTFHSVILAGVYDVKNIRMKIRPEEQHKVNSPWNIATDFLVDMSFSKEGIAGMLREYEADCHTGMEVGLLSGLIYDYTSGYPFLVSKYCKLIDERVTGREGFPDKSSAWTKEGFLEAEKIMLSEGNTLFDSLINKLTDYPELEDMLRSTLFTGEKIAYNAYNEVCQLGTMFGFIKNNNGILEIANRTFEIVLYNYFMSKELLRDINKSKTGVTEVFFNGKTLIEATV